MVEYLPVNEGKDHINVYSKSALRIGRNLSNFAHTPFEHTQDGHFESVEGYWYWLTSGGYNDSLRLLYGYKAKEYGKTLARVEVADFNERVLEAIRCKLRQHRDILTDLTATTLPLTHYYWYGTLQDPKIVRLDKHNWMIDEMTRIRTLMRAKKGLS